MLRSRFAPLFASSMVAVLLLAGCGDDTSAEGRPTVEQDGDRDAVEIALTVDGSSPDDIDRVLEVVQSRLDALGIEHAALERSASGLTIELLAGDEGLARSALEDPLVVEFRPVLWSQLPGTDDAGEPGHASVAELVVEHDGSLLGLGPVALDNDAVEAASAFEAPASQWTVDLTFAEGPEGIDAFNEVAAACYAVQPSCPDVDGFGRGSVAIVVDGQVLSASSIQTPSFERDQISISGGFDEREARILAAALEAGTADATWSAHD